MSGRIRTIKPEWKEDEKLAALSDAARVLSVALILVADDHGNGRAHHAFLASQAWPYGESQETLMKVSGGLRELLTSGFIHLYEVAGQRYFRIRNWAKHQKVQHVGKARVPGPHESLTKVSGESHETLTPDLRPHTSDLIPTTTTALTRESLSPRDPEAVTVEGCEARDRRIESVRGTLLKAYQRRYVSAFRSAWVTHGKVSTEINSVAAWVVAEAEMHGAGELDVILALMDGVFDPEDVWMREHRCPWGTIAKDPAKFAARAPGSMEAAQ